MKSHAIISHVFLLSISGISWNTVHETALASGEEYRRIGYQDASIDADGHLFQGRTRFYHSASWAWNLPEIVADVLTGQDTFIKYSVRGRGRSEHKYFKQRFTHGTRHYQFKVYFPEGFESPISSKIFWQAWQGSPWGPPINLKARPGPSEMIHLVLRIRNRSTGPNDQIGGPEKHLWRGNVKRNTWYQFEIGLRPRYRADNPKASWIQMSINGQTALERQYVEIGYIPERDDGGLDGASEYLTIKMGLYQPGENTPSEIYFDDLVITN